MKKILLLSITLGLFLTSFVENTREVTQKKDNEGIQFYQGTWNQVVNQAKRENI